MELKKFNHCLLRSQKRILKKEEEILERLFPGFNTLQNEIEILHIEKHYYPTDKDIAKSLNWSLEQVVTLKNDIEKYCLENDIKIKKYSYRDIEEIRNDINKKYVDILIKLTEKIERNEEEILNFKFMHNPHRISIDKYEVSKEQYTKLKYGEYYREQGNRIDMYFENNWLYIKYAYDDGCLFKVEIKKEYREYFIDEFFVEGDTSKINKERLGHSIFETDKENIRLFYHLINKAFRIFGDLDLIC